MPTNNHAAGRATPRHGGHTVGKPIATLQHKLGLLYAPWWAEKNGILVKGMTFKCENKRTWRVLDQFDESPGYLLVCLDVDLAFKKKMAESWGREPAPDWVEPRIYFHPPTAEFGTNATLANVMDGLQDNIAQFAEEVPGAAELLKELMELS